MPERTRIRVRRATVGAVYSGIAPALRGGALSIAGAFCALACDTAAAQDAAEERSQSFTAVRGAVREDVPGGPLLIAAYGVIWALVLLYVIRLVRLQQRAQSDLQRLEQLLARTPPRAGG